MAGNGQADRDWNALNFHRGVLQEIIRLLKKANTVFMIPGATVMYTENGHN
jgi:hypothetical protein